jgi:hypothetical protein
LVRGVVRCAFGTVATRELRIHGAGKFELSCKVQWCSR